MAKAKEEKVLQGEENTTPQSLRDSSPDKGSQGMNFPGTRTPTMAELVAAEKKRMEEYITIQLLKDNGKYKDDVYVSVNGQNCRIQRGIPVRIKRKFAMELAKSQYEDQRTAARIALLAESAAKAKL